MHFTQYLYIYIYIQIYTNTYIHIFLGDLEAVVSLSGSYMPQSPCVRVFEIKAVISKSFPLSFSWCGGGRKNILNTVVSTICLKWDSK